MITPDKFLQFAKRIMSVKAASEEECRSAVSRAYYSLYHETLQILVTKYSLDLIGNIQKVKKKTLSGSERAKLNSLDPDFLKQFNLHQIVFDTLVGMNYQAVAMTYKNYRIQRNQADYDLKMNFLYNDADAMVKNIEVLVGAVKSL
ncbi:MAG TPA: hypothetical protein VI864_04295 [Candidatus Bathyarchaeia archaeon]|nr:hypothetical protein [Candidatus Bathyarchaeia archaeon]